MSHVFISYVKENWNIVKRLCDDLKFHGIDIWLDRNDIKPGCIWKESIHEAIKNGSYFIACFSVEYYEKGKTYMNEELTLAIEELRQYPTSHIWFIPVLLSECDIPYRNIGSGRSLMDIQWIPLYENWEEGISKIITVIRPENKIKMEKEIVRVDSIIEGTAAKINEGIG